MAFNKSILYILILSLFYCNISFADITTTKFKKDKYCIENNLGWKFYCDEEIEKNKEDKTKKDKKEEGKNTNTNEKSYLDKLKELQKKVEEAKAKAVLEPTEENVREYMFLQQKIVNQASYFSDMWRRILWITPELDYTQKRPVSNVGKQVWENDRNNKIMETLKNIKKRYGIFFVYSTKCSFCQKYSQILYDFKKQYNIEIKGISIDNNFLPLWEKDSFIHKGQLEKLGVEYNIVPITILYDNITNSSVVIGYGLMTHDELMERIYIQTQTKVGEDY